MAITIDTRRSPFQATLDDFNSVMQGLAERGHNPIVLQAKQRYLEAFTRGDPELLKLVTTSIEEPFAEERSYAFREIEWRRQTSYGYGEDSPIPIAGDLFLSEPGNDILYLALASPSAARRRGPRKESSDFYIEIGYVGKETGTESLVIFTASVDEILASLDIAADWAPSRPTNPRFAELADSEGARFLPATDLPQDHLELSSHLEDPSTRSLALVVKRSGGILAADLVKKAKNKPEEVQDVIEHLTGAGLLAQEYVIICHKTSNQINRVSSQEAIEKMAKMGVLCSCGRLISEERVEELFTPTSQLQKMLDQSYWMTANLLRVLDQLNIPKDRIMFNLLDGAEEIDAFVDLDGALLMFELKDSEFSMGHAYPFGARIGLYKPDLAIIVSTNGVAREVKEHFERIKPSAEIVYVDHFNELASTLGQIARRVRSARARRILLRFEPMATVVMPLANVLAAKIGLEPEERPRRRTKL